MALTLELETRDGNFASPLPASPRAGLPRPAKVVGRGWGEILDPHHGAGRGWVYTFYPRPAPSPPRINKG